MQPIYAIGLAFVVLLSGCAGLAGDSGPTSTFDLVVQNEGTAPATYQITVTDESGEVLSDQSDAFDPATGQEFELPLSGTGVHEVVVSGEDWSQTFSLDPANCEAYEGTIRITDDGIAGSSECVTVR